MATPAGTVVIPGSELAIARAELDRARGRNLSRQSLDRAYNTGSAYHWKKGNADESSAAPLAPGMKKLKTVEEALVDRRRQANVVAKAAGLPPVPPYRHVTTSSVPISNMWCPHVLPPCAFLMLPWWKLQCFFRV